MTQEELERYKDLVIEQEVLWRLKRVIDGELETVQKKMIALVQRPGPLPVKPLGSG